MTAHAKTELTTMEIRESVDSAAFDQWLSSVLNLACRAARAEAWDEGFRDGKRQDSEGDDGPRFTNPYR